jgi:hypothetical protein
MGFPIRCDEPGHALRFDAQTGHPRPEFVALIEDRVHAPNASRIAFWAESRAEVDRLGSVLRQAGTKDLEGPMACPEYSPDYYAVFFEDPSGNRLEVWCRIGENRTADQIQYGRWCSERVNPRAEGQAIAQSLMTRLDIREDDLIDVAYVDLLLHGAQRGAAKKTAQSVLITRFRSSCP